ncbi:MAG: SDR family oxidoreductase [Candidatus Krumholzibacteriota bacterium]|nr:SDR family oxidoreductase [Candidatus Krumholzibacteriota bacterium]
MAKYLVTGGAGFIGSNIVGELVARGEDVVVFDDLSTGHEKNLEGFGSEIEFIKGDIRRSDEVRAAMRGIDHVLHQAALASVPRSIDDPVLVNDVNINGTLTVLEEAKNAGVKSLVYAASSSAYGETEQLPKTEDILPHPLSPYAVTKLVGEYYCSVYSQVYGLPTISMRYFNVFGPKQDPASQYAAVIPIFISHLLKGKAPTIYGDGKQSRDFTYVKNVVNANIAASKCGKASGQMINVACGGKYTLNELYSMLSRLIGVDIDPVYAETRPGDVKHSHADITMAEDLFDYSVEVPFEEGLKRTVDWYRKGA